MSSPHDDRFSRTVRELARMVPDLDLAALETCFVMRQVTRGVLGAFEEYFHRHGLSLRRFGVLLLLHSEDAGLGPAELADVLGVARASMTGFLDGLERAGLVQREQHPDDRRMVNVRVTPKGRELVKSLLPNHLRRMTHVFSRLAPAELTTLRSLMEKVRGTVSTLREAAACGAPGTGAEAPRD